ncbi:hypothetical protein GCM10009827_108280 [Dactylosporangium maewongense]|uniref:Uncharacterized protein n=1 Tax=Dactylosporangium maewongense TaxID=634393 RepID=A0ABN2D4W4_9ACTN
MYLMIVAWDLARSEQTTTSLRDYLRGYAVDAFTGLPGMLGKFWFSNEPRQIWGAVYLWTTLAHADPARLPSRAVELIGYEPTSVSVFALEAVAAGADWSKLLDGGVVHA